MKKKKIRFLDVLIVLLLAVFLFSAVMLLRTMREYAKGREEYSTLKEQVTLQTKPDEVTDDWAYLDFDYDSLREINGDFLFWIDIPGTGISYPVVQSTNNDYYLRRTFAGEWNVGGVIFVDYRCSGDLSSPNTVIYGHRMNDGSMFTALRKFVDSSFLEDYSEIHVYRDGEMRIYRVFSCRKTDVFDECYTFYFDDDAQFGTWLRGQAALSAVGTGIVPGPEDRILTLSTCATSGDEYSRYVVQAVLEQVLERHPGGKS